MKMLVTGCAGFIGSTLVDRLLLSGHEVVGLDNFSTGRQEFLIKASKFENFQFIECDLLSGESITRYFDGVDVVFHFSANADVRFGTLNPKKDLEQNTIVTFNVLEAMRKSGVKKLLFSSTGSVYGEANIIPTPENCPFPIQTSLYGASKIACEGLISSYCEGYGINASIFRFVSILGERYTHGHVFDFVRQLKENRNSLNILGNGKQRKSYLYVQDCIDAVLLALDQQGNGINIFNLGVDDFCEVNQSVAWICEELNVSPSLHYSGGDRGWIGDNPFIFLDTKRIQHLGWTPKLSIKEGVIRTVQFLQNNDWVFSEEALN